MVGSNRGDYESAKGLARMFAGHGSDGLVRIENASLWTSDAAGKTQPVATAYTYRSHSGFFGIVNSEEAYQNLVRFLFGDVRVDLWFDVDGVTLAARPARRRRRGCALPGRAAGRAARQALVPEPARGGGRLACLPHAQGADQPGHRRTGAPSTCRPCSWRTGRA
jgi:hypothetical protein